MKHSRITTWILALAFFGAAFLIAYSSTKNAMYEVRETLTKERMYELKVALDAVVNTGEDMFDYFASCDYSNSSWCQTDDNFVKNVLINKSDPEIPYLPGAMRDGSGAYFKVQATETDGYMVVGRSVKEKGLCFISASKKEKSNLSTGKPSACPE